LVISLLTAVVFPRYLLRWLVDTGVRPSFWVFTPRGVAPAAAVVGGGAVATGPAPVASTAAVAGAPAVSPLAASVLGLSAAQGPAPAGAVQPPLRPDTPLPAPAAPGGDAVRHRSKPKHKGKAKGRRGGRAR